MSTLGRRVAFGVVALAGLAVGTPAFAGAWPVTHQWNETARAGDATSGSFAYEYGAASIASAGSHTAMGTRLDCADFAITLLCEYAAKNGLEVVWTLMDPQHGFKTTRVSSTEARFTSPAQFTKWSRDWINAKMVATLNTVPVERADLRAGDLYLMRWSQLGDANPFPGRDVWHTYYVGDPDKLLFYGNDTGPNNDPLPILATAQSRRLEDVSSEGKAVYEGKPRRWSQLASAIVRPEVALKDVPSEFEPRTGTVSAARLNVRARPSASGAILRSVPRGTKFRVEGVAPYNWVRVRLQDGTVAYVSGDYVKVATGVPAYSITGWEPPVTPGLTGAVDGDHP